MQKQKEHGSLNKHRLYAYILVCTLLSALIMAGVIYGDNPISDSAYYQGTQVKSANYIIFIEGSNYYALNGDTGAIDYSGSIAETVIQNAINAIDEGVIFITAGTYVLTGLIQIRYDLGHKNLAIRGAGASTVIYSTQSEPLATDVYVIRLRGDSKSDPIENITISNMKIMGNEVNHHPLHIFYGKNIRISNVIIKDGEEGIVILQSDYTIVENSLIENTETAGIEIVQNSHRNIIRNNYFLNANKNQTAEEAGALRVWQGSPPTTCWNNMLLNNIIVDGDFRGINIVGALYTTVDGNHIIDVDDEGIYVGTAEKTILSNNQIHSNGNSVGIQLGGNDNKAVNNIIYNSAGHGIWAQGNLTHIFGNRIRLTGGTAVGIYLSESNRMVVTDNQISHTASGHGIYLSNMTYTIVALNNLQAKNVTETGSSSDWNLIHGNIAFGVNTIGGNTVATDNIEGA